MSPTRKWAELYAALRCDTILQIQFLNACFAGGQTSFCKGWQQRFPGGKKSKKTDQEKFARAAASDSNVGMASMRRVTVSASRTRPGPQTKRSTPPSRAS